MDHSLFMLVALLAGVTSGSVPIALVAMPVVLPIVTFLAWVALVYVPITVSASPIGFPVLTLASISLGIVEITVIAPPRVLSITTLARVSFGSIPPIGRVCSISTSFHIVSIRIAEVAGVTGPVIFSILALITGIAFLDSFLAVLAIPLHFKIS